MKRAALILLVLPLSGCFAEQKQQIAACKLEAQRLYPNDQPESNRFGNYITTCMEAHGYESKIPSKGCFVPHLSADNAACYQPGTWLGRIGYQIEMAFKSN